MLENLARQTQEMINEFFEKIVLEEGSIIVLGGSSSEVGGHKIGTDSSFEIAQTVFKVIYEKISEKNIYIGVQCCEHLNRAIIVEKEYALKNNLEIVNVLPQPKAGGSFATTAHQTFKEPVAVEKISANAGIDIGDTLIGMHLKAVAVPVRLQNCKIGNANIVVARTRPRFIGGERAMYNEKLL